MASPSTRDPAVARLALLTIIFFVAYFCVALPLPILPVFVATRLGLSNAWAGLSVGAVFFATIATRGIAGNFSDRRGPKLALARGLILYVVGAAVTLLAALPSLGPVPAYVILLAGRLVVGLGESLVAVGVIAWGIGMVGLARSGKALSWIGAAIYGAFAVGGPIGLFLFDRYGLVGPIAASAVLPCLGLAAIQRLPAIPVVVAAKRASFVSVLASIWRHGAIVCLQGIGFAGIGAFLALYFRDRGWAHAGLGLTAFGAGFVLVRLFFGHLPDRFGGLPVAIGSLAIEVVGQMLIWSAAGPLPALLGSFMTGLGCSLIYPAMGREIVRFIAPQLRGAAISGFTGFQDLAYGLTGPLAGLLADRAGYDSVYAVGAAMAAAALVIALRLRFAPAPAAA